MTGPTEPTGRSDHTKSPRRSGRARRRGRPPRAPPTWRRRSWERSGDVERDGHRRGPVRDRERRQDDGQARRPLLDPSPRFSHGAARDCGQPQSGESCSPRFGQAIRRRPSIPDRSETMRVTTRHRRSRRRLAASRSRLSRRRRGDEGRRQRRAGDAADRHRRRRRQAGQRPDRGVRPPRRGALRAASIRIKPVWHAGGDGPGLGPARGPDGRERRARHGPDPVPGLGHRGRDQPARAERAVPDHQRRAASPRSSPASWPTS